MGAHLEAAVGLRLRASERERARTTAKCLLKINVDARMMVAAAAARALARLRKRASSTKQRGKKIAELRGILATGMLLRAAAKLESARPIRRWPKILAAPWLIAKLIV